MVSLIEGNAAKIPLRDGSVQMVVTSPPYWGLRDYGLGGGGIGLELTVEGYIESMVRVGRELWRVLRDDGTLWMNLGDSYAGGNKGGNYDASSWKELENAPSGWTKRQQRTNDFDMAVSGLKHKDLCGVPWRGALAFQADGWYLRSDIIWAKPNPMPESVTDRPTKAHEYIFLLTKKPRYFYDAEAVRESGNHEPHGPGWATFDDGLMRNDRKNGNESNERAWGRQGTRNRRTVWSIATQPYGGAHFATFPEALVEPCIKAGTSEKGCCPECGRAWERVVETVGHERQRWAPGEDQYHTRAKGKHGKTSSFTTGDVAIKETVGFRPGCDHGLDPVSCVVFDPFAGSGTAGLVARRLGRDFIGLDLSADYLHLARKRLGLDALDIWNSGAGIAGEDGAAKEDVNDLPLFGGSF